MSQFDNVSSSESVIHESDCKASDTEDPIFKSPISDKECDPDSSLFISCVGDLSRIDLDKDPTPPNFQDSKNSSHAWEESSQPESPTVIKGLSPDLSSSPTIQSSAIDLGLDPTNLHVFVLSDAGKPIYTRYGDESKLAHVMGVIQAFVSVVAQENDQIRTLVTNDKQMVLRICGHLILVAVASSREPTSHLAVILKYVYNQILSVLTQQRMEKWFTQKHNLDLRNLLIGDHRILSGAIELVETQMGPTLNAVLCIPLTTTTRETVVQDITLGVKSQDLVFAILLTNCRVVCIVSMKKHFLHPMDIHLITNIVFCSKSFKNAPTNWLPICLPKFNPNGYLYANLSYLDDHSCLVLLTVDSNQFYALQALRDLILSRLESSLQGRCLRTLATATWPDVAAVGPGAAGLRHFVCKLIPAAQYTTCRWSVPYYYQHHRHSSPSTAGVVDTAEPSAEEIALVKERQADVLRTYRCLHKKLHSSSNQHPICVIFQATDTEAFLASKSDDYEIYMTLEPLVSSSEAFDILKLLTKWISANKSRLFILTSPTL